MSGPPDANALALQLPPLPAIQTADCLPEEAIRDVAGYPEHYVQGYAREYAVQAVLAERQRLHGALALAAKVMGQVVREIEAQVVLVEWQPPLEACAALCEVLARG